MKQTMTFRSCETVNCTLIKKIAEPIQCIRGVDVTCQVWAWGPSRVGPGRETDGDLRPPWPPETVGWGTWRWVWEEPLGESCVLNVESCRLLLPASQSWWWSGNQPRPAEHRRAEFVTAQGRTHMLSNWHTACLTAGLDKLFILLTHCLSHWHTVHPTTGLDIVFIHWHTVHPTQGLDILFIQLTHCLSRCRARHTVYPTNTLFIPLHCLPQLFSNHALKSAIRLLHFSIP